MANLLESVCATLEAHTQTNPLVGETQTKYAFGWGNKGDDDFDRQLQFCTNVVEGKMPYKVLKVWYLGSSIGAIARLTDMVVVIDASKSEPQLIAGALTGHFFKVAKISKKKRITDSDLAKDLEAQRIAGTLGTATNHVDNTQQAPPYALKQAYINAFARLQTKLQKAEFEKLVAKKKSVNAKFGGYDSCANEILLTHPKK